MSTTELSTIVIPESVTPAQHQAWLQLADAKNSLVTQLTTLELAAQGQLVAVKESSDYAAIDTALAAYRKTHTELQNTRKAFTANIDAGIIQPLMAFEKRVDPKTNAEVLRLIAESLRLRKIEADKAAEANAKAAEKASFKSFVQNEFLRIVSEYTELIRREFTMHYNNSLRAKTANLGIDKVKEILRSIPLPALNKFTPKLITKEELAEVYNSVPPPDFPSIFEGLMKEMDTLFAGYESDLANSEAAIKHHQEQQQLAEIEANKKLAAETSINTLIASSEAVTIDTPKIKKTIEIVVIESEAWAMSVIAAFVSNLPKLTKYIRVNSWSALNIGQMAKYLGQLATDEGLSYNNLTTKEVEK